MDASPSAPDRADTCLFPQLKETFNLKSNGKDSQNLFLFKRLNLQTQPEMPHPHPGMTQPSSPQHQGAWSSDTGEVKASCL